MFLKTRMVSALAACVCAAVLSACGGQTEIADETRRVVIGGALTETLYALNQDDGIVAVDITSTYPEDVTDLPKVGYPRAISAEGVLGVKPTEIIAIDDIGPQAAVKQIEATGVKVITVSKPEDMRGVYTMISTLGALTGTEKKATDLANAIWEAEEDLSQRIAQTQKPKALLVLVHGKGPPMVAGRGTAGDGILALSGAENVAAGFEGYKPLTPEAVVELAPEVIVTSTEGLDQHGGSSGLLSAPGFSETPAGKAGRVVALDPLLLLGFGPRTVEAANILFEAYHQGAE